MAKNPTPAQAAARQAAQIVAAQLAPVRYAQAAARRQTAADQANVQRTRLAVIHALQSGIPTAQGTYDQAVQQTNTLAQNAAHMLANANPNQQTQAELAQINAPAEQRAQLAQQAQQQFGGQSGVLYTQQGSIPGASLLAQRQGQLSYLAGLPTVAALSGEETLRGLQRLAQQQRDKYLADTLSVTGQIPQLATQLQQQQIENARANRAFAAQQAQQEIANQLAQQQAQSEAAYRQAETRAIRQGHSSTGRAAVPKIIGSGATGYYMVDPYTGRTVQILGPAGTKKGSKSGGTRGFTPYQIQKYKGTAATIAQNARHGAPAQGTQPALAPITYNDAVKEMEQEGIPLSIAVAALNRVYPAQYKVTKRGLVQTGIRGQPSWGKKRKPKKGA